MSKVVVAGWAGLHSTKNKIKNILNSALAWVTFLMEPGKIKHSISIFDF
jgi:hypothetical protein